MSEEQKHTPLPWYKDDIFVGSTPGDHDVVSGNSADTDAEKHANAAYIVEACNAYPVLRAKVEELTAENERLNGENDDRREHMFEAAFEIEELKSQIAAMKEREAKVLAFLRDLFERAVTDDQDLNNAEISNSVCEILNHMEADNE